MEAIKEADITSYQVIQSLLGKIELQSIQSLLKQEAYSDGKNTATAAAREVKQNLQVASTHHVYLPLQQMMLSAINQSTFFKECAFPKHVYPFVFSKYSVGMEYGWHVDSPVMGDMMRTDLAMTVFLNDASAYEGGELELQTSNGMVTFKLNAGDAVCYPCTQIHRVRPVTKGERCVAVTWIQSMIKDNESRTMLRQLKDVMKSFDQKNAAKEAVKLQQVYSNLYRLCAD